MSKVSISILQVTFYSGTLNHCLLLHSQYVARREGVKVCTKEDRKEIAKKM